MAAERCSAMGSRALLRGGRALEANRRASGAAKAMKALVRPSESPNFSSSGVRASAPFFNEKAVTRLRYVGSSRTASHTQKIHSTAELVLWRRLVAALARMLRLQSLSRAASGHDLSGRVGLRYAHPARVRKRLKTIVALGATRFRQTRGSLGTGATTATLQRLNARSTKKKSSTPLSSDTAIVQPSACVRLALTMMYTSPTMSHSRGSAWGSAGQSAAAVASATSVKLHDVMDEELAAKLQREEQEQWEREMEGRFGGEDRQTGWCFVEVPSSSSGHGVMSVIQQEVTVEDAHEDDNDPDYTFALELQAQEAEEYDRMRRQEASSMERVRVIRQEDPKREEVRHTLQRYYDREAHGEFDRIGGNDPVGVHLVRHNGVEVPRAHVVAARPTVAVERPRLHDPEGYHDVYLDGAGWRVPKKQFNSALKQSDRKTRHRSKNSSSSGSASTSQRI